MREKYPKDKLHILVAKRNSGSFTYDGIETGAERVTREIEEVLEELERKGDKITKISIIGYSLGGLVGRYTVGLLQARGLFDRLQPMNFTTFATPHLGIRTPLLGWRNHIWNVIGARTLSVSGHQMFMIDSFRDTGRPLLSVMADANSTFVSGLRRFHYRSLYSNIINDRSVTFYTSYISRHDPFVDMQAVDIHYLRSSDSVILDPSNPVSLKPIPPQLNERLAFTARRLYKALPLLAFITFFLPIAVTLFLLNAVLQNFQSAQRIKQHETSNQGIANSVYRSLPLFVDDMRRAAESAFENVNAEHEPAYLPPDSPIAVPRRGSIVSGREESFAVRPEEDDDDDDDDRKPLLRPASSSSASSQSTVEVTHEDARGDEQAIGRGSNEKRSNKKIDEFPTLALTSAQFKAIEVLDGVGWNKYAVHIKQVHHTHAAIIVRMDRKTFEEGRAVGAHWVKEFQI